MGSDQLSVASWQYAGSSQGECTMNRDELLDLFRRCSALIEGHFRLSSGLHSPGYLQCDLVLQHPQHARVLGARAIFAEREDGALRLRRGFSVSEAERVLVVEDVVTTGGSTRETIQVATAAGAQVVATWIVSRVEPP